MGYDDHCYRCDDLLRGGDSYLCGYCRRFDKRRAEAEQLDTAFLKAIQKREKT